VRSGLDGSVLLRVDGAGDERLGFAVAGGGDLNDDGYDDVLIGAPNNSEGGEKAGKVYVYSGADGSMLASDGGSSAGDRFGSALAVIGDVDGDGGHDFVVGAPKHDGAGSNAGKVFVYSGVDGNKLYGRSGDAAGERFGASIAGIGDVNDDGRADFAVGAPDRMSDGLVEAGRVAVVSGLDGSPIWIKYGNKAGARLGWSVDTAGDVDGDGLADLLCTAPRRQVSGMPDVGRVYLRSGPSGTKLASFDGSNAADRFGEAVAGRIDFNGDGDLDFVAGAPRFDDGAEDTGYAYLIDPTVIIADGDEPAYDEIDGDQTPGDVNGDGVLDAMDIVQIVSAWGTCDGCPEDVNGDGLVDSADVVALLPGG
jgi:hypothetical protein